MCKKNKKNFECIFIYHEDYQHSEIFMLSCVDIQFISTGLCLSISHRY